MPTLKIAIGALGDELRAVPKRDRAAIQRGAARTMSVDAYRWFDWSLRGGGARGTASASQPPKKPRKPRKPRQAAGLLRKLLTRLRGLLDLFKGKRLPRVPKGLSAADPCARKDPPAYRVPVDTGDYANSGRHEVLEDGAIFYSATNPPIKAGVIEFGRRPAPIPIAPLQDWVRRKLGCTDPVRARGIAFAISKAAAKTKRPGLHVFERMRPPLEEAAYRNILRELRKIRPGVPA